ncbi:7TM domain-containing protein [Patescibacteria group bacterium]
MKLKNILIGFLLLAFSVLPALAQDASEELPTLATESAVASESAEASKSAIAKVVEKKPDITEPEGEIKGKLERYLEEKEIGSLSYGNVLQHTIREAVSRGVPANTIVLLILFPVVAAIIAASRHLLGLRGFGIFTPAVLSVAFVATGLVSGILVFLVILMVASMGRMVLRKMKLHYLPRMALLLWFVSLGVFALMYLSSFVEIEAVVKLSIFPILILVLLAENFIEVQIGRSRKEAVSLTMETVVLAVVSSLILSLDVVQRAALLNPEIIVFGVLVFDVFVGKYVGLRYMEYVKFRKIITK